MHILSILGTEAETVENIEKVFCEVERKELDGSVLEAIVNCETIEVASLIYYKVSNAVCPQAATKALRNVIIKVFQQARIVEDSIEYRLVHFCLQQLLILGCNASTDDWFPQSIFFDLIREGSVSLLKGFIAIGCSLPLPTTFEASKRPTEMLKLYACHGHFKETKRFVFLLFQAADFSASDFEDMIKGGYLKTNFCMNMAMNHGRLDLAYVGYKNGLCLPCSSLPDAYFTELIYRSTPTEMIQYIAMNESFLRAKLLLEAISDVCSFLKYIPKDILLNQICMFLNMITLKFISLDIFVDAPPTESNYAADAYYWDENIGFFSVDDMSSTDDEFFELEI